MSETQDQQGHQEPSAEASEDDGRRGAGDTVRDGIKHGLGMLSALKDAIEETISEARERGDLNADRAKELMKQGLSRAQTAAGEARERLDFATQRELDELVEEVARLRARLDRLDGGGEGGPTAD